MPADLLIDQHQLATGYLVNRMSNDQSSLVEAPSHLNFKFVARLPSLSHREVSVKTAFITIRIELRNFAKRKRERVVIRAFQRSTVDQGKDPHIIAAISSAVVDCDIPAIGAP